MHLWQFLKIFGRFIRFSGAPKLFSRMFLIQTHDKAKLQLQQQKKKRKIFMKQNWATSVIVQHLMNNQSRGLKDLRYQDKHDIKDSVHHVINIQRQDDSFDIQTVASQYDPRQQQIQFQIINLANAQEV